MGGHGGIVYPNLDTYNMLVKTLLRRYQLDPVLRRGRNLHPVILSLVYWDAVFRCLKMTTVQNLRQGKEGLKLQRCEGVQRAVASLRK